MADKPIIFSGPMVRAIIDGRKTMTRRVLTPVPYLVDGIWWVEDAHSGTCHLDDLVEGRIGCMKFQAGDRLWVREAFAGGAPGVPNVVFRASCVDGRGVRWRPSIHMPRWASRITLHVTDVRVQRVQEISEADARAEGVLYVPGHGDITLSDLRADPGYSNFLNCRQGFELLWGDLNAKRGYGWEQNPWVVAITFRPEFANIDAAKAAA